MKAQLGTGVELDDIQVGLQLIKLKPVHACWIVEFYNHVSTPKGKKVIDSGWKSAGIFRALELVSSKMPSTDHLYPTLSNSVEQSDDRHLLAICDVTAEEFEALCRSKVYENDDDTDSQWEETENWISWV